MRSAVGSCAPHSASLGSGWRTLLEVLRRAAADPEPSVTAEAMAPLQVCVEGGWEGGEGGAQSGGGSGAIGRSRGHGTVAGLCGRGGEGGGEGKGL